MNNSFSVATWLEQFLNQLAKPAPVGHGETLPPQVIGEILTLLTERRFTAEMATVAWDNVFLKPRTYGKKQFHVSDLFPDDKSDIKFTTHNHIVSKLQREIYQHKQALQRAAAHNNTEQTQTPDDTLQDMIALRKEMFELQEVIARQRTTIERITKENTVQLRKLTNALHYLKTNNMLEDYINNAAAQNAHQQVPAIAQEEPTL